MSDTLEAISPGVSAPAEIELVGSVVGLPKKCRLPDAEELIAKLRDYPVDDLLLIDAAHVEYLGSPCVLALASLIATRNDACATTKVQSPPEVFIEAFRDLGLFQELMKMEFC